MNDYVLVEKEGNTVYLNYHVPYNASQFSGTGVRDAEYYWDTYVTKLFTVKSKQLNDGGSMALKPPYMEGYATDKRTGKPSFIGMYLVIVPNAASVVIGTALNETAFRKLYPKANDPFGSDLAAMTRYNKFAVAPGDIVGKWQNGNTSTAQWYYTSPSGYEGYAGMTLAATSATFNFNKDGTYTSIHNGATGAVGNMNTFQQEYKGKYTVSNWAVTFTNRYGGKTDRFDAYFEAVRGGRILKLNNGAGQDYNLQNIPPILYLPPAEMVHHHPHQLSMPIQNFLANGTDQVHHILTMPTLPVGELPATPPAATNLKRMVPINLLKEVSE